MNDLELRLTDLLARKADEVDIAPVDGFAENPYRTAWATADPGSVADARDLASTDAETTSARPDPSRNRRRIAQGILAAAAAAAVALVMTRDSDDATPADQPSPTGTLSVTVAPRALFGTEGEQFVAGTYFVDEVGESPTPRIFLTLGDGWYNAIDQSTIRNDDVGAMSFSRIVKVSANACHAREGFYPGSVTTLDGLVAALAEQAGWLNVTAPTDISINGYLGKTFQRTAPPSFNDCNVARDGLPDTHGVLFRSWEMHGGDWAPIQTGEVETLRVLDVDGTMIVINTRLRPEHQEAAAVAELATVLDSIRIEQI